ncbi:MAG TPA: hypothetical protein VKP64_14285 [Mycobacteriales bacterium]|nr:hypothetical protein [Mycobacteriales bacterium]
MWFFAPEANFYDRTAAELGVHPSDGDGYQDGHPDGHRGGHQELYLMCDDIEATLTALRVKGAELARPVSDESFGRVAWLRIPGGGELAMYEPRHPTAIEAVVR